MIWEAFFAMMRRGILSKNPRNPRQRRHHARSAVTMKGRKARVAARARTSAIPTSGQLKMQGIPPVRRASKHDLSGRFAP